jgi:inosose dehydratase
MSAPERYSRRELLGRAGLGAAALALAPALRGEAGGKSPYGPFKMGIQSYSLRGFDVDGALQHTKNLGLRYWEAYSAHVPLNPDPAHVAKIKEKLKAADVRLLCHGVNGFGADQAANRRVFEAAKALGIETISADPTMQALDQLNDLVQEFKINIAIHNHGPRSRYDKLQQVVDAVKDRHRRIGASADLGHFLRSGEDPVKVVEALGDRIHSVHLKDVKDGKTFTILGKGDMNLYEVLKALKAVKFDGVLALEYEENPKDPIADIQECLAAVRAAADRL